MTQVLGPTALQLDGSGSHLCGRLSFLDLLAQVLLQGLHAGLQLLHLHLSRLLSCSCIMAGLLCAGPLCLPQLLGCGLGSCQCLLCNSYGDQVRCRCALPSQVDGLMRWKQRRAQASAAAEKWAACISEQQPGCAMSLVPASLSMCWLQYVWVLLPCTAAR